ncbi:hypothetical protein GN956_G10723 [Arapaima gigas]
MCNLMDVNMAAEDCTVEVKRDDVLNKDTGSLSQVSCCHIPASCTADLGPLLPTPPLTDLSPPQQAADVAEMVEWAALPSNIQSIFFNIPSFAPSTSAGSYRVLWCEEGPFRETTTAPQLPVTETLDRHGPAAPSEERSL